MKLVKQIFFFSFCLVFLIGAKGNDQAVIESIAFPRNEVASQSDYIENSLRVASLIHNKAKRSNALAGVSSQLARSNNHIDTAVSVALSIPKRSTKERVLNNIAREIAERGLIKKASEIALLISDMEEKYYALFDISASIKDPDLQEKFYSLIEENLRMVVDEASSNQFADECLRTVTSEFLNKKEYQRVLGLSELLYDQSKKSRILCSVVGGYCTKGEFQRAFQLAQKIPDQTIQENAFDEISDGLIAMVKGPEEETCTRQEEELDFKQFRKKLLNQVNQKK